MGSRRRQAAHFHRIDVRGLLVPAGSWTSLLRPAVFIVPAPLAVSPTESLVVIAWATFTDARNTSLRFIMQLLVPTPHFEAR